ncbi:unnamed protein product, partial [marine sediment metagenome]
KKLKENNKIRLKISRTQNRHGRGVSRCNVGSS